MAWITSLLAFLLFTLPIAAAENSAQKQHALYFLLSNSVEQNEVRAFFPSIQLITYDLPDIQDVDPKAIVTARIKSAFQFRKEGTFVTQETGLALTALNGLPGALYKWFQLKLGNQGLVDLARALGNDKAEIVSFVAFAKNPEEIIYFSAILRGHLVSLRGDQGLEWEAIFQPDGEEKTLAEMDTVLKQSLSPRRAALEKLKVYLENQPADTLTPLK